MIIEFGFWLVVVWVYTFGVGMFAAYYNDHPPTDCGVCNNLFALTWPGVLLLKLLRRDPFA